MIIKALITIIQIVFVVEERDITLPHVMLQNILKDII